MLQQMHVEHALIVAKAAVIAIGRQLSLHPHHDLVSLWSPCQCSYETVR